jgi:lipoyl(octanoyl) transferase
LFALNISLYFACLTLDNPGKLIGNGIPLDGHKAGSRTDVREPGLLMSGECWPMNVEMEPGLAAPDTALQVYLLGSVNFEAALRFQRRLHYEVSGDRRQGALVVCEHPPLITVGRAGSRAHLLCEAEELRSRQWRVRWVNRGGGCVLHVPGQLAVYPILPLDRFGLGLEAYLQRLHAVIEDVLADFDVPAATHSGRAGVWSRGRLLAAGGVAVRDWVSYFGMFLNVNPGLEPFRLLHCGGAGEAPMTSLARERRGPLSASLVRQRLVEHFCNHFAFARSAFFSSHPSLNGSWQRCQESVIA